MPKYNEKKRELLAFIDAIVSILEQPYNENDRLPDMLNLSISVNPFELLLSIINKFVTYEEMIEWLSNILTWILPVIEIGVKGVLLSNLKERIDCNIDPIIPNYLRRSSYIFDDRKQEEVGINIYVPSIDYKNMFSVSPLSRNGQAMYFGTKMFYTYKKDFNEELKPKFYSYQEAIQDASNKNIPVNLIKEEGEISSIYELVRAQDFNAFLWFIINKAKFIVNGDAIPQNKSIFECFEIDEVVDEYSIANYSPGYLISNGMMNNLLCIKMKSDVISNEIKSYENAEDKLGVASLQLVNDAFSRKNVNYQFVTVSNQFDGCNWYVNSGTYFQYLVKPADRVKRDYNKDKAICNVRYLNSSKSTRDYTRIYNNVLNFTILPKPSIIFPKIGLQAQKFGETSYDIVHFSKPFRKKILFGRQGETLKKGNYSVNISDKYLGEDDVCEVKDININGTKPIAVFTSIDSNKFSVEFNYYLYEVFDVNNENTENLYLAFAKGGDDYFFVVKDESDNFNEYNETSVVQKYLYECYRGTTVYEFNYDFVMGMKLFDPEVVASQLIEEVCNISLGVNVDVNINDEFYKKKVSEIVKNIVNSQNDYTVSDCFYRFSNEKYDKMLRESELKRSQLYEFSDSTEKSVTIDTNEILDILSEFDDEGDLVENKETINRAFSRVANVLSSEMNDEDKYSFNINFINNLITSLVTVVVESLLTPKVIMLFQINKQLLGDLSENYSFESFLESISGLLVGIIREVRDIILRQILDWAIEILMRLKDKLVNALIKENYMYYVRLMQSLIKACRFNRNASEIDNVDYADIDPYPEQPNNNEC